MADIKLKIQISDVKILLESILNEPVLQIEEAKYGKVKAVYFFSFKSKDYVIRFSESNAEFGFEKYLQDMIKDDDFPLPTIFFTGCFDRFYYSISEKIEGVTINTLDKEELFSVLPSIKSALFKLHSLDIKSTEGYGFIGEDSNGGCTTFTEFLERFFSNEQDGFWNGWFELFQNGILEYEVFNKLYRKMIDLAHHCEGRRNIVHSDFHFHNVIVDSNKLVGIIDWGRASYLDYIFDVTTLALEFPQYNLLQEFQNYYKDQGIDTTDFTERFLCAALCLSLDGMRFWAKLGHEGSYKAILNNVLEVLERHGIVITD